jgi:hypothetical protein
LYGLRVDGLPAHNALVGTRSRPWHPVALERTVAAAPPDTSVELDEDRAVVRARDHSTITVDREPLLVTVAAPGEVSDAVVVHPLMAFVGAVAARWTGRSAFHGAAVLIGGRAWVLLAEPGGGKSTLSSALAARGHPVLADDLAVVDGHTVLAGPRSCDLRAEAAERLDRGTPLATSVGRPRWREELAPAPYESPLGGFIELGWADEPRLSPADGRQRLSALTRNEAMAAGPTSPTSFLDLLDVPAHRLERPASWDALTHAVDLVEEAAGG